MQLTASILLALCSSARAFALQWDAPVPVAVPIDGYVLRWYSPDGAKGELHTGQTTATLDLPKGAYTFTVSAVDEDGNESAASNALDVIVLKVTLQESTDMSVWTDVVTTTVAVDGSKHFWRSKIE